VGDGGALTCRSESFPSPIENTEYPGLTMAIRWIRQQFHQYTANGATVAELTVLKRLNMDLRSLPEHLLSEE
jgi:hypothetical protein